MNNFEFSPADGLMDKTSFPTNLGSETEARQQFMTLFNQLKSFMNDEIVNSLNNKNTEFTVNGDNWYWKDKNTGLIRQGGIKVISFNDSNAAYGTITFPIPFKNKVLTMSATEKTNTITSRGMFNIVVDATGNSDAFVQAIVLNLTNRTGNVSIYWEATGY